MVFPAHAGIVPGFCLLESRVSRLPCTRGDRPRHAVRRDREPYRANPRAHVPKWEHETKVICLVMVQWPGRGRVGFSELLCSSDDNAEN
jgi:hypothetical protein